MGLGLEVVSGRVTNPGATITALTANTGDSFSVKSFDLANSAWIEALWGQQATAGVIRIRSPRMHDNVQNLRFRNLAAVTRNLIPQPARQRLYPQDTLVFEQSGGGAEVDTAAFLVYYTDLPGVAARLRTWAEIAPRVENILTVETNHTTGATAADYGGGLALNANFDLLEANVDYAILGYETDATVNTVGYRGPDTGNLRVGGPGTSERIETRDWFKMLSEVHGTPHIPVVNAANRAATTVDLASTATAAAVNVTTFLAQLTG